MSNLSRLPAVAASLVVALFVVFMATALTPGAASAQKASDQEAVMSVVYRFNLSTVEATDTRDTTPVREFTTDELYRELALDMRADWSSGLVGIDLVDFEWGTVTVTGDQATAYTVETWSVTFANGATGEMSPTINLYHLVLENGVWKIDSNEHPGSTF
jgi:hypothetical protein